MRRLAAKLLGVTLVLGTSTPAFCAAIKSVPGRRGSVIIQLSGGIVPGDGEAFIVALQKAARRISQENINKRLVRIVRFLDSDLEGVNDVRPRDLGITVRDLPQRRGK